MKKRKPKPEKWHLYHWNATDGYAGLPKRKIQTKRLEPCLLHIAYLGGGVGWREDNVPEKSILGLILDASPFTQSDQSYYKFFDTYNSDQLSQKFTVTIKRLTGYDRARWQVERSCSGMSDAEIDVTIGDILSWHYQEIRRIINYRPALFS